MEDINYSHDNENIYADLEDFHVKTDFHRYTTVDNISNHSNETEIPSDPWMDEADVLTLPIYTKNTEVESENAGSNKHGMDLKSMPLVLKDLQLRKQELQLLSELAVVEAEQKISKENDQKECEKLHKEIEKMQKEISKKDEQISELSTQNMNLKKNICSLYKTAKAEIDRKDALLCETNKRLDRTLIWCNSLKHSKGKKDVAASSTAHGEASKELNSSSNCRDQYEKSRKRDPSPNKKRTEQSDKSQSYEDNYHPLTHLSCSKSYNSYNMCNPAQPIHRDLTKTDAIFFKLLPDIFKKSFQNYEQTQVVSLNKLKQTFVNNYFSNATSDEPTSRPFFFTNTIDGNIPSTFNESKSENQISTGFKTTCDMTMNSSTIPHTKVELEDKKIKKSTRKDILNLYMYRREKLPFLVKRRYGLLKQS